MLDDFVGDSLVLNSKQNKCQKMALAEDDYTNDGTVDIRKNPANKRKTGNWKACRFILGMVLLVLLSIRLVLLLPIN